MISTATALTTANVHDGSGPKNPQTKNVPTAMPSTTSTNQKLTLSARRCMGARERWAWATSCTICASTVPEPTFSARMMNAPVPFIVAPTTLSPGFFSTGMGSPVSIDSSTLERPSSTSPSTGTFSPGRTRRRSPTCTCVSGMSSSVPSALILRAVFGARPSSALSAAEVLERAVSSRIWPSRVSDTMIAAASKYTATRPCSRNDSGKRSGATVATTLYPNAAPTPVPISVHMFGLRLAMDCAHRWKNGQAAHRTTGRGQHQFEPGPGIGRNPRRAMAEHRQGEHEERQR